MNKCAGCGQDFGSLSAFDHHQRWVNGTLTCLNPAELGMHQDSRGRWRRGLRTSTLPVKLMTDDELMRAEAEAVAANHDGCNEDWIQVIADEINRREENRMIVAKVARGEL
jgi:hypothetical protein